MPDTERDQRIMEEHHEIAAGRIAEAERDAAAYAEQLAEIARTIREDRNG